MCIYEMSLLATYHAVHVSITCHCTLCAVTNGDAIEVYTPERPYIVYTGSKNEKKLWLAAIRETIYNLLLREEKCSESADKSISKWWALDRLQAQHTVWLEKLMEN